MDSAEVQQIEVDRIRPEDGLGRKRDREGHRDLQRSIAQFGVLTPITVRPASDGSGDYLLIKGQGRTLACRLLGIKTIPATVVNDYSEDEKVQQFLVENVARLKMRPVDRALLIHRARLDGEETASIARRFGVSATTVRKMLAQLENASGGEVAALRAGDVTLALHSVIAANVSPKDRAAVVDIVGRYRLKATELEHLLLALGWGDLESLGEDASSERLLLLAWACDVLNEIPAGSRRTRFRALARQFPTAFARVEAGVSLER